VSFCAVFSPDGTKIAGNQGPNAKVWDAATGRELLSLPGLTGDIRSLSFNPDGTRIVTAHPLGQIKVWNAVTGNEELRIDPVSTPSLVSFTPDGKWIVASLVKAGVLFWDAKTGQPGIFLKTNLISCIAFSAKGDRLILAEHNPTNILVCDATTGQTVKTIKYPGTFNHRIVVSPNGQRIASSVLDGTVRILDVTSVSEILSVREHKDRVAAMCFSPDGHQLASGDTTGQIIIWDATPLPE